ncbi:MAG: DNA polymerase III subunit chi [Gammaproteobacteria bacterium]
MTQVDFYILTSNSNDSWLRLACRIAEKARQKEMQVYLHAAGESDARTLDELLWTFSQGSFIPHRVVDASQKPPFDEPVLIGRHDSAEASESELQLNGSWDLMINLAPVVPEFFSRYDRVAEVIDGDAARREKGRDRFRFYRDRGYELKTHHV